MLSPLDLFLYLLALAGGLCACGLALVAVRLVWLFVLGGAEKR
jgi:hypothetical protein